LVSAIGIATLSGAAEATSATSTHEINIYGLRSTKFNVLVCVTAYPRFFPYCCKYPKGFKTSISARDAANISFSGIAKGTYAVALVHDYNANNKMDMAIFLPKEGFGFSRNPAIVAGPP